MKGGTENRVSIFIAVLVVGPGLFVVFPLPDIWPLENYSMFSGVRPSTVVFRYELRDAVRDRREVTL